MSDFFTILDGDDRRRERDYLLSVELSEKDLKRLYELIRSNDNPKGSYASWIFTNKMDQDKKKIALFVDDLILWLPECQTQGILRSMLRSVSQHEAPQKNESEWIDLCFHYLIKLDYEIAVKVHAMQILFMYCKKYPELATELKGVIENGEKNYSPALAARSRNILKSLERISENLS
ncbi:MAG: hypothetical protein KDC84_01660 [Crocinitomicaceae bacterium]|nr:hypothetical protein [Crocinitomicaceae bacterium]